MSNAEAQALAERLERVWGCDVKKTSYGFDGDITDGVLLEFNAPIFESGMVCKRIVIYRHHQAFFGQQQTGRVA